MSATPKVCSIASVARSVDDLNTDFENSRGDARQLERLRDELEAQKGDKETGVLRLKVIHALLAARKSAADAVSAPQQLTLRRASEAAPQRSHDLTAFLSARNLRAPDYRSLYLYRVTDGEISELRIALQYDAKTRRLDNPTKIN